MSDDLRADESDLIGQWLDTGTRLVGDSVEDRIQRLLHEHLERVGADTSGWDMLYRDPRDGRLWELTYPQSGGHGGGPARLTLIAPRPAAAKYPALAV